MKSKTILRYLSTTSDSFLVVAFAVLVSTPFILGIATRPQLAKVNNNNANYLRNVQNVASESTPQRVLGVSDTTQVTSIPIQQDDVYQNINVSFPTNFDSKKITLDSTSATSHQYTLGGTLKQMGTYNLFNVNNTNNSSITLVPSISFTGSKANMFNIIIGGQSYKVTRDSLLIPSVVVSGKSQTNISISSDAKNLDSFSFKVELKS